MINAVVYDIEIRKGILGKNEKAVPGIEYCAGWHDRANMGVSVVCGYDYRTDQYRVFFEDNFEELKLFLTEGSPALISFNGLAFDNKVLELSVENCRFTPDESDYDILVELWKGAGLDPEFRYPTHTGFGLDACAKANLGAAKTGNGALAPVWWQQGHFGKLVDYCLTDVKLTKALLDRVLLTGGLRDPRNPKQFLPLRKPPV